MEEQKNMQQTQENGGTLEQSVPQGNAGNGIPPQILPQGNAGAPSPGMPSQPQPGYGNGMPVQMNAGNGIPPQIPSQGNAGAPSPGMPVQPGYGNGMPVQMNAGAPSPGMPVQPGYGNGMLPQMNAGNGIPPQILPQMNPGYGMPAYGYANCKQGVSDGLAVASMVLGIVSVLICIWFYVSLPCAILGLILGCVYRAKGGKNGMSVAGIACSSVAVALALLMVLLVVWECMYLL